MTDAMLTDAETLALMASGMGYQRVAVVSRIARLTRAAGTDRVRVTYSDLCSGRMRAHHARRTLEALEAAGTVVAYERAGSHVTVGLRDGWATDTGFRIRATNENACTEGPADGCDLDTTADAALSSAIADALDAAAITPAQRRVAAFVLRHTVDAGRAGIAADTGALAHSCRLIERDARWCLRRLVAHGIVLQRRNGAGLPATLSINPDTAAWHTGASRTTPPTKE